MNNRKALRWNRNRLHDFLNMASIYAGTTY